MKIYEKSFFEKKIVIKNETIYYFEDDIIKKEITVSENYYHESELNEKTAENRTMILPKTKRGKIKIEKYTTRIFCIKNYL